MFVKEDILIKMVGQTIRKRSLINQLIGRDFISLLCQRENVRILIGGEFGGD